MGGAQRSAYEKLGSFEVRRVDRREKRCLTEVVRLVHVTSLVANDVQDSLTKYRPESDGWGPCARVRKRMHERRACALR